MWRELIGPFYSIDVECVAIGCGHQSRDRLPARVALVDGHGDCLLDCVISISKQQTDDCSEDVEEQNNVNTAHKKVVSYLTPLTGLTREMCHETHGAVTFHQAVAQVKELLPEDAVLVGQSIAHDVQWLGLERGRDFRELFDICTMFRQAIPGPMKSSSKSNLNSNNGVDGNDEQAPVQFQSRFINFSLRHTCLNLLQIDIQNGMHDPVVDAKYSIELFQKYRMVEPTMLRCLRDSLHRAPPTPSFASLNPVIDGVCMNKFGYRLKWSARIIWRWWVKRRVARDGITS